MDMDRRKFIQLSLLASGAALGVPSSLAASADSLRLTLRPNRPGNAISEDFTGFSYETAQLRNPYFFSAKNTQLVGFCRRLSPSGVLRIGGNTSAFSVWTPKPSAEDAAESLRDEVAGPDTGKHAAPQRAVTPLAIDNLRGFLDATGWKLIYGLNLGGGTPETAADEAEYVAKTMGSKLIAFQLCNEPDLFTKNGLRAKDYNFEQFAVEWQRVFEAVRQRVPGAPLAGPDTAFNNEWLVPFAQRFKNDVIFLSQHYYAEGPPDDPLMTIERLLNPDPKLQEEFDGMERTRRDTGLPFRMAETNSCWGGGKATVSDTFASALWSADLMYQLAVAGGMGINFHSGGYGWYTPIAGAPSKGFLARPLYYGMLLFAEAGAGTLVAAEIDKGAAAPLLNAYGLSANGTMKAVILNKHADRDVALTIDSGTRAASASVIRLQAPRLNDTADTTLGGAPVGAGGDWSPAVTEKIAARKGKVTLLMPKASGALVTFGS
jgi:hypothetical protein